MTTPTSASGIDHACARSVTERTAPMLPATIRTIATTSETTSPAISRRVSTVSSRTCCSPKLSARKREWTRARPDREDGDVGDDDERDEDEPDRRPDRAGNDGEAHAEQPDPDERLELERLVAGAHARGDDRAQAEHRGEVEGVRADDDADRDGLLVLRRGR